MLSSNDISAVCSTFAVPGAINGNGTTVSAVGKPGIMRINTEPGLLGQAGNSVSPNSTVRSGRSPLLPPTPKDDLKQRKPLPMIAAIQGVPQKVEEPNSPEAKKRAAIATGPLLKLDAGNPGSYGMQESLFSALKDIFETIIIHNSRTGVISPQKFVEVLKRENEMFRSSVHQDAHEFLNYVLNQIIENVEQYQRKLLGNTKANGAATQQSQNLNAIPGMLTPSSSVSTESETASSATLPALTAGWIHDLFEGLLTSETKCLTCETLSRRDEVFLDLSIDLEKHSSVTCCLRNFSASEMLCERNKFYCDCCGGLQEAEKRMKIKRLPRILALHLKRFKYSEEMGRHQKLFHRVVYPYHLRLFNTTDDAEDADRLYELYAVVVHIGGGPYHGHYVTIVKTEDKGWLLFDDELVEPVDKSYVRNFFGDEKRLACAYVLFYQETTFEKVQKEMQEEQMGAAHTTAAVPVCNPNPSDNTVQKEGTILNGDITISETEEEKREKPPLTHSLTTPVGYGTEDNGRILAEITAEHHMSPKRKKRQWKDEKTAAKSAAKLATHEEANAGDPIKEGKEKVFRLKSLSIGHNWFGNLSTNGKEKDKRGYETATMSGSLDENTHPNNVGVPTNGNGVMFEATCATPAEIVEPTKDAQAPDLSALEEHQPLSPGKPPKDKRKGLWSGLRRKTSIMMNDG